MTVLLQQCYLSSGLGLSSSFFLLAGSRQSPGFFAWEIWLRATGPVVQHQARHKCHSWCKLFLIIPVIFLT